MGPIAKLIRNPVLVLGSSGEVVEMNDHARRAFGRRCAHWRDVFADGEQLRALLARASGSAEPVVGALDMPTAGAVDRARVTVLALRGAEGLRYALEIRRDEEDRFAALTGQLRDLNAEIAARRRAQARLEESLSQNRLLYRELQHRVKNHLQMMLALVSAAGRESEDPSHKGFAQTLQAKLSALFDAQRLMYADENAHGVRADHMLNAIADTVQSLAPAEQTIEVQADALVVPNDVAFPLALIANELLTNAIKHGDAGGLGRVTLSLRRARDEIVMQVRDQGKGFTIPQTRRSSSGLGLVRGLCRQIGGRLEVGFDQGSVVTISYAAPEATHVVS